MSDNNIFELLIDRNELRIEDLKKSLENKVTIRLSEGVRGNVKLGREYLENKLKSSSKEIYGINTGFGSLHYVKISDNQIEQLQTNLVRSHACGTGDYVPKDIAKLMVLLKIKNLSFGKSGARLKLVEKLVEYYNNDIIPVIYELGSLGASGDLSPLAHLSLPLLGEGLVYDGDKVVDASIVLNEKGIKPILLRSKEGLALLNGTQFSTSYGIFSLIQSEKLLKAANFCVACSLEAYDGLKGPFNELIHKIRPHKGQIDVSKTILEHLSGSEIQTKEKNHVQDPYSFRCVPQVHGASQDTYEYVKKVLETEINSVTDNPIIFPEEDQIISGGNFHAQPIALALDFLAIAMSEIGNISERRIYRLMKGKNGLPQFLINDPGLNSGFMIAQYTAASIVNQNKMLANPSSTDSIVSSNGQEDHVSMAANSGTKLLRLVNNVYRILAIEIFAAFQGLEFRRPLKSSENIEKVFSEYRKNIAFLDKDRMLSSDFVKSEEFLRKYFS